MKVGIMSMQRIINYGSFLIAFSLKNTLQKMGHTVEFVDYKIEPCIVNTSSDSYIQNLSERDKQFMKQVANFKNKFKNVYLKKLGVWERNERPDLDLLIIGSDEVFNCLQSNPDVGYSLELFGKNAKAKKIISYAASCGSTTYAELEKLDKIKEISDLLNKFDDISVRDNNSKEFIEKLTGISPKINLDPVLLYNFENEIIDNVEDENYIIVYSYNLRFSEKENETIKSFAKKHNKKIICLGMYQTCCDKYIPADPLEVLAYFKKADYIFTDTFHGSIFSIKAQKPFATMIRESNKEKLEDLLYRFNLSDRILYNLDNLENLLLTPINFSSTNSIIEAQRKEAYEYLNKYL